MDHALRAELFYDFLACALMTIGIFTVAAGLLRRNRDLLLTYFGLFSFLYGLRLAVERTLIESLFGQAPLYTPCRALLTFLVPIPLLLFFIKARLIGKVGKAAAIMLLSVTFLVFLLSFHYGHPQWATYLNNSVTAVALLCFITDLWMHRRAAADQFYPAIGFSIFLATALFDNLRGLRNDAIHIEPVGMSVFIATLGFFSLRRAFSREERLISIESELELARRIQQSLLPTAAPVSPHFRLAARYVPMTDVAGDFYDFVINDESRLALLIADVSGHGIPAALIASMVKLAAASHRDSSANPSVALAKMNQALSGNTQSQFVTAALLYLDTESRSVRYSAAAHPPMLLLRKGEVSEIQENGLMLAAFSFAEYQTAELALHPGDRFLLYTDGLAEAADQSGEFFGTDRLAAELRSTAALPPDSAVDAILARIRAWQASQDDDLTLILCDYQP